MSSRPPKKKPPSGPPPWNLDDELSESEDVSFDDWPAEGAAAVSTVVGEKRPSQRPSRRSIPPEVPGWPPAEGTVLLGKYKVERVLGKGGMGVVVVARHLQLAQKVAIKFLHPAAMEDPDVVARFAREARVLAQIQSEHVVRIVDVGTLERGEPYMVMEYLEGTDLSKHVKVRGPLPLEEAVDYLVQASEPLAEAHIQQIIHRDLKPSNLYLARRADGTYTIKVIDFGISKVHSEAELSMTKTSVILGSPLYISPEQLRSAKDVDARSDIWALGVILYKLLTGHPPFMADTIAQLCAMILLNPPPRITELRPDLPGAFEDVLLKCIQKDPDQRYQNVGQLVDALAPFLAADAEGHDSVLRIRRLLRAASRENPSGVLPDVASGPLPPSPASSPSLSGSGVSSPRALTDGGAALTVGGATTRVPPPPAEQSKRRMMASALGAGLAIVAAAAGIIALVKLRAPSPVASGHDPVATAQTLQPLPPLTPPLTPPGEPAPAVPVATTPTPPPTATANASADPPPSMTATSTTTAPASSATTTTPSASGASKKPNPPPHHPVVKPPDNSDFGGRK